MPDLNSSKETVAEENLPLGSRGHQEPPSRGWTCPNDDTLTAYLEGRLLDSARDRLQSHLSKCHYCRSLTAGVIQGQRAADLPALPSALMQRAIDLVPPPGRRLRWIWAPATALAGVSFLVIVGVVLHAPEPPVLSSPSAPAAPVIARSEPPTVVRAPIPDIVRKSAFAQTLPSVIFPPKGSTMERSQVELRWKAVPHSRYYEARVLTAEGDLIWESQSEDSRLKFPDDVPLKAGPYFVRITAYLDDGRVAKSAPVRFQVKAR